MARPGIHVVDPFKTIARYPELYLGHTGTVRSWMVASALLRDALALEVSEVTAFHRPGAWTSIAGTADWTVRGPGRDLPIETLFGRVIAFEKLGRNACRHEIVVHALADDVFVVRGGEVVTIKGTADPDVVSAVSKEWPFSINFRIRAEAERRTE